MQTEIWLTVLSECAPSDAISRDGAHGTWIAVDYEVEAGSGVMLLALLDAEAPPLTLGLDANGWYEIRIGVYYGSHAGILVDRMLCLKLSDDRAYSRIGREHVRADKDGDYPEKVTTWSDVAEVFWKCADLTGQDLVIAHPPRGEMAESETNITWVRLFAQNRFEGSQLPPMHAATPGRPMPSPTVSRASSTSW